MIKIDRPHIFSVSSLQEQYEYLEPIWKLIVDDLMFFGVNQLFPRSLRRKGKECLQDDITEPSQTLS